MGCLNSEGKFDHWFGNIHLSGPCNRRCYFCIGQHMMSVDSLNTLNTWPLSGMDKFKEEIDSRGIREVNLTGTNTEPMLYAHIPALRELFSNYVLGVRSNGALALAKPHLWRLFDKASVTLCSLDLDIHRAMMGLGEPADIQGIVEKFPGMDIKVNIVLGPENVGDGDVLQTIHKCAEFGVKRINLREPYGQPHVGCEWMGEPEGSRLGMPCWTVQGVDVTYWDVHYVEVESVNLFANGHVSITYPITKGVDFDRGDVLPQSTFSRGRVREQWL